MRDTFTILLTPHKTVDKAKGPDAPQVKADLSVVVHNIESLDQNHDHCVVGMVSGAKHAVTESRALIIQRCASRNVLVQL